jgi:hypothetical protein
VGPGAAWQVYVAVLDAGAGDRGDEEGVPDQELVVCCVGRLVVRVLEKEGPQDGGAGTVAFFEEDVEVGEEALAKLEHLPAHRLVRCSKGPRLLVPRSLYRMVAAERLEDTVSKTRNVLA